MNSPSNEAFQRYVTGVAFSLQLSAPMIAALDHMMNCPIETHPVPTFTGEFWTTHKFQVGPPAGWITSVGALLRRGLLARDPTKTAWYGSLPTPLIVTEEGQLVYELCIRAGLLADRRVMADASGAPQGNQ